jgi:mono/diheme cytochrome c family protein
MRHNWYQYTLIAAGIIATVLIGIFWQRELFPEYKIYQDDYIALEKFKSTESDEPIPVFQGGIKQIVFEHKDNGPPGIERCVSCHVTLDIPYFSPTKIDRDINGNLVLDAKGLPVQVPNEDYIWKKLGDKIAQLTDSKINEQLKKEGNGSKVRENLLLASQYEKLKTAKVGDNSYNVTKVLQMHPLIGRETRPFEYHSMTDFGCTSCHNGNGQGLTTEKAHGPVFDGTYDVEYEGPEPTFTESDPENDPLFAFEFNHKPGPSLIFQTSPLFVGPLVQAKCMNCHQDSQQVVMDGFNMANEAIGNRKKQFTAISKAFDQERNVLVSFMEMKNNLESIGLKKTKAYYSNLSQNYALSEDERNKATAKIQYLENEKESTKKILDQINLQLVEILGSQLLVDELSKLVAKSKKTNEKANADTIVNEFIDEQSKSTKNGGSIFKKMAALHLDTESIHHLQKTEATFEKTLTDPKALAALSSEIDSLTKNYHHGEELFISQACYACHKIAGFARGGVGPELTHEGTAYPWFIKQSIVWPQADLPSSTMPNYHLDHEELQDLVTYLLGQNGGNRAISSMQYTTQLQEWEAGKKMPWEKPITPAEIQDVRYGMKVFATQGCSACHRLKGFESNIGYKIEMNNKPDFDTLYREKQWFTTLIPETMVGSDLVKVLEKHGEEIDKHIVDDVRQGSILEEIDQIVPGQIESLYTGFKFASRAKNHDYEIKTKTEKDPKKKAVLEKALEEWKERVHRVMMIFIQEYGLGRLIGPRPNWSGVYRSDEWLMEHFHNPSQHVARSIMPVMPFDDTKFYALTHMLDVLGKRNRDDVREIWNHKGFNPEMAYIVHCSQCHGDYKQGNGPVTPWIYPIPKNLNNAQFLRNLTKERVIQSIAHGVNGTPMPPWGEVGINKPYLKNIPILDESEIKQLTDWLFSSLPGAQVIKGTDDVQKWRYSPEDVIKELRQEGNKLKGTPSEEGKQKQTSTPVSLFQLPRGEGLLASLKPLVTDPSLKETKEIFEKKGNPIPGEEPWFYYIKKNYYTVENIQAGKAFFEMNCAVCHGAEADGAGARAEQMKDAKPRMLINLDWSQSRDDLRLLRSIKYGVPGTAMTPWGDLTSSLQRLQLVMFIRNLNRDPLLRKNLETMLYEAYEPSALIVEKARGYEYHSLTKLQTQLDEIHLQREKLNENLNTETTKKIVEEYQKELDLASKLKKQKEVDEILLNLRKEIGNERNIYLKMGNFILAASLEDSVFENYLKILSLNKEHYYINNKQLTINFKSSNNRRIADLANLLIQTINEKIAAFEKNKPIIEGKISSIQRTNEIKDLQSQIDAYTKLRNHLLAGFAEAKRSQQKQQALFGQYEQITQKNDTKTKD